MKKRIACILLSVVLLLALIPASVITVNAAAYDASDECVAILKQLEGFSSKPYWDYGQYTVGYGTACPTEDYERYCAEGIPEEEADALLRTYLTGMGGVINNFASQHGLNLTQNQFDALLLFTYNCGSSWMSDSEGMFSSAVINGKTGNDFIFPIVRWCVAGGSILDGLIRRRLSEANLYLNGVYSTSPPSNYTYVRYDANGGTATYRIQGYDSALTAAVIPTATRNGYLFEGWYTAASGGTKVTTLDASMAGRTLYAHWVGANGEQVGTQNDPAANIGSEISAVTVTVTNSYVNLRQGPGTSYTIVGEANKGDTFTITATATGNGYTWGKYDGGWLALMYTNYDSVINGTASDTGSSGSTAASEMGTVTSDDGLRIRSGAGTNNSIVGFLSYNERVEILDKQTVGSSTWGKISSGWICLDYVKLDNSTTTTTPPAEMTPTEPEATTPDTPTTSGEMGTITGDELRIRSGAGTSYSVVGYLNSGDRVEILEKKDAGSMTWGKITNGWISMSYVKLDSDTSASVPETTTPSTSGTTTATNETGTVVYTDSLRIRSGPSTDYAILGFLSGGTSVTITERTTTGDMEWGKISEGWISLDYVEFGSSDTSESVGGTVIASDFLRIRSGPSTSYSIAGYLDSGDHVQITERKTVGGSEWGKISKGWICMDYIRLDGETSSGSTSTETDDGSMTVIADCLCVRSGAGLSNGVVDYLYYGDKVTVTETTTVDGMTWGKISGGWISMDYVQ